MAHIVHSSCANSNMNKCQNNRIDSQVSQKSDEYCRLKSISAWHRVITLSFSETMRFQKVHIEKRSRSQQIQKYLLNIFLSIVVRMTEIRVARTQRAVRARSKFEKQRIDRYAIQIRPGWKRAAKGYSVLDMRPVSISIIQRLNFLSSSIRADSIRLNLLIQLMRAVLIFGSQNIAMNNLLSNLTKFISTTIELYQLPYELTNDLHTLNAYLRSYTPSEETLLEGFVNRQVQKLEEKLKNIDRKQMISVLTINTQEEYLKNGDSFNKKYESMRITIPTDLSQNSNLSNVSYLNRNQNDKLSSRSGHSSKNEGIKSERHKFGTRQRNKTQKMLNKWDNKENIHSTCNLRIQPISGRQSKQEEKYGLKHMHSEAQLFNPLGKDVSLHRQSSTDNRRDELCRPRTRYESHQSKGHTSAALKIRLKLKPSIDLCKLSEGIADLLDERQNNTVSIRYILDQAGLNQWAEVC